MTTNQFSAEEIYLFKSVAKQRFDALGGETELKESFREVLKQRDMTSAGFKLSDYKRCPSEAREIIYTGDTFELLAEKAKVNALSFEAARDVAANILLDQEIKTPESVIQWVAGFLRGSITAPKGKFMSQTNWRDILIATVVAHLKERFSPKLKAGRSSTSENICAVSIVQDVLHENFNLTLDFQVIEKAYKKNKAHLSTLGSIQQSK